MDLVGNSLYFSVVEYVVLLIKIMIDFSSFSQRAYRNNFEESPVYILTLLNLGQGGGVIRSA